MPFGETHKETLQRNRNTYLTVLCTCMMHALPKRADHRLVFSCLALLALLCGCAANGGEGEKAVVYESAGLYLGIPGAYGEDLCVNPEEDAGARGDTLFRIFHKEAFETEGLGLICTIQQFDEPSHQAMVEAYPGRMATFAQDGSGRYCCVLFPGDIESSDPAVRESMDQIQKEAVPGILADMIERNGWTAHQQASPAA